MDKIEKIVREGIMTLLPIYIDMKGNCTKVITMKSKEVYLYKSVRTVLKGLSKYFMVDLESMRRYYGEFVGCKNNVPIVFNSHNIFIPIKTRKPICRNDGSFGYFNLKHIEKLEEGKDGVYVVLKGNIKCKSMQRMRTIKKHIREGKVAKRMYDNKNKFLVMEGGKDFYTEFTKPATKGDIAVLRSEILDIKSKLGK